MSGSSPRLVHSRDELLALLVPWLGAGPAAIIAGHFGLDVIRSASSSTADGDGGFGLHLREFGQFTWDLTCQALRESGSRSRIIVIVNDWQWVRRPASQGGARMSIEDAIAVRRQFFAENPTLPASYLDALLRHGLDDDVVLKCAPGQWMFSETELRDQFSHRLYGLVQGPEARSAGLKLVGGREIHFESDDGDLCLSVGGSGSCSGTIAELLRTLSDAGIHRLAVMTPVSCFHQVDVAGRIADGVLSVQNSRVLNIGFENAEQPDSSPIALVSERTT